MMVSKKVISSVFASYNIDSVILIETSSSYDFVIDKMPTSVSLQRWENLENVLKDMLKKNVNLITLQQSKGIFDLTKGEVIR